MCIRDRGENSFAISAYCEKLLPMLREEEGRAWWMPVSYTHLGCIADIQTQAAFKVYWAKRLEEDPDIDPVSYTHLDVYKRQTKTRNSVPSLGRACSGPSGERIPKMVAAKSSRRHRRN